MSCTRRKARLILVAVLAAVLVASGCSSNAGEEKEEGTSRMETAVSPATWPSGVWLGGAGKTRKVNAFGAWRGTEVGAVTAYPAYATWREMETSNWHVASFNGFEGRLAYGLPLLADEGGTLQEVAAGKHDGTWRAVARTLLRYDRGDSFVRVGLEANGTWFRWGATAETADDFKAAYRHVVKVMRQTAPELEFVFDISCSVALEGVENDRMASLTRLYPGDDVVDVVGCDHYDSWSAIARSEKEWEDTIKPDSGPGLTDVVKFAREHDKQFAVPEWGLSSKSAEGAGDNPFFIKKMYQFFYNHRDVLAFENYFDEPDPYLGSSLFLEPQNPKSAAAYRELW